MKCFFAAFVFAFLTSGYSTAQFTDNFSDGNLNEWDGNKDHFIVNAQGQLQLNAPAGSTNSWLYTVIPFSDSMSWDIFVALGFAPSTSNQLRIYLGLTSNDFVTASGYYLEIGASGDQDALEFKYQETGSAQIIASSVPAYVATDPVELRLRITKNGDGVWECFNMIGVIPELLFTTTHNLIALSSLNTFGLYCKYTDTRRDKFIFDDISIQPIQPDVISPSWLSISVLDNNSVTLLFDEPLEVLGAMDPSHYILSPGNLTPDEIIVNGNQVTLSWISLFISQQTYTLSIANLSDQNGNPLVFESKTFVFTLVEHAEPNEIIITEIMADPTPTIGLPDAEYIEIFNNSSQTFTLSDYKIRVGTNEKSLPDSILLPGEYVIVTDDNNISTFSPLGRVIAVDGMATLTNSGTSIAILNSSGEIIHSVNYNLSWYRDVEKSNGGWSLEMINPLHVCADQENWIAANNLLGGTPGSQNSQWSLVPDLDGPELLSLFTGVAAEIELRFDEKIDAFLMLDPALYSFSPELTITSIELSNSTTLKLTLSEPLESGVSYELRPFSAFDCIGNGHTINDTTIFGLVTLPVAGDILINEILFNPGTGGSRFIEVINISQKFISLNALSIGRISSSHTDIFPTLINEILGPGEIAVFSPEPADILTRYNVSRPDKLYDATLPAWSDKSDNVSIIAAGVIIDSFTYSSSWHHPVIADENGVSLERVSSSAPTASQSTWHSASSLSGYATPTGPNSQNAMVPNTVAPFTISPRHFSPNDDGFNDFLIIQFELESGNDVGSIWVYDLEGREIHQVLTNETLGTSALIQWDGRNAEGLVADMGIYLLFVQLWDEEGNVRQYQEACSLVKR